MSNVFSLCSKRPVDTVESEIRTYFTILVKGNALDNDSADAVKEGDRLKCTSDFRPEEVDCSRICIVYVKSLTKQIARLVCRHPGKDGKVTLKALNPAYPDKVFDENDVEITAIVIGRI